jgi:hypothetical protein
MWYELELYSLIAALVFSAAGFLILCMWLFDQAKDRFFANPLAISRTISRNRLPNRAISHTYQ